MHQHEDSIVLDGSSRLGAVPASALPMALPPHADDGIDAEEDESLQWPPKHALASAWDGQDLIRAQMRSSGKLLVWANPAATGIASKTSVKMNRFVIAVLMKIWGQHHPNPKSPPIGWLRQEVR